MLIGGIYQGLNATLNIYCLIQLLLARNSRVTSMGGASSVGCEGGGESRPGSRSHGWLWGLSHYTERLRALQGPQDVTAGFTGHEPHPRDSKGRCCSLFTGKIRNQQNESLSNLHKNWSAFFLKDDEIHGKWSRSCVHLLINGKTRETRVICWVEEALLKHMECAHD